MRKTENVVHEFLGPKVWEIPTEGCKLRRTGEHPGETLRSIMRERKVTLVDVCKATGIEQERLEDLLCGDVNITFKDADALSKWALIPSSFWMAWDSEHRAIVRSARISAAIKGVLLALGILAALAATVFGTSWILSEVSK